MEYQGAQDHQQYDNQTQQNLASRFDEQNTPIKSHDNMTAPSKINIQVVRNGPQERKLKQQQQQIKNQIQIDLTKQHNKVITLNDLENQKNPHPRIQDIQRFVIDEDFLDNMMNDQTLSPVSGNHTDLRDTFELCSTPPTHIILEDNQSQITDNKNKDPIEIMKKSLNKAEEMQQHKRMHSDYQNTPDDIAAFNSSRDKGLSKKVIELLENGLQFLNSERIEEALREFKVAESIFNQQKIEQSSEGDSKNEQDQQFNHSGIDDNYLSVLKYNMSCCYQKMGLIDQCVKCLQEAIVSLDRKVKSIKDRKNNSFDERSISQQQLSLNSQNHDTYDQELILGNLLHKYRYQCKFHLQVCAVLSQMNRHELAYEYGNKASKYAMLLMNKAYELCQLFVNEINKKREINIAKQRRSSAVSGAQSIDEDENIANMSPYGHKNSSANQIPNNLSQQSLQQKSILSQATQVTQQVQINNYFASSTRNNSVCNRSSDSQNATRVNIRRASSADGSLERIHTFNLKLQKLQNQKTGSNQQAESLQNNDSTINVAKINLNIQPQTQNSRNENNGFNKDKKHFHTTTSVNSQTSNPAHKVYYVEEKTKVLENIIMKVQPTINEFQRIINEFATVCDTKDRERQLMFQGNKKERQKHAMKISFHDDTEINLLKFNHKFKLNVRNILGIKHQDDWIFNLNIGNVMHLTPMNTDELAAKLDRTHELNKDAMLEKIILFVVSFFCVGTELRFLSQKEDSGFTKKDSEMWHAKSLHTASLFLPEECPLVNHIINSYKKHHLNAKLELQRQKKLEDEQKRKKEAEELKLKEQSLGLGGYSTIQANSKESIDGNNSQSIGEDHEAMNDIKQQIENFLQKSKKSTGGAHQSKVNIQNINNPVITYQNTGQHTARPFSNSNMVILNKQQSQDDNQNERRRSNLNSNSRNTQLKTSQTAQNQNIMTTHSLKNLGSSNQKNLLQMNQNIFQTLQNNNSQSNFRQNQSPSNVTNDSASMSIDQKISAFASSKRLSTNLQQKKQVEGPIYIQSQEMRNQQPSTEKTSVHQSRRMTAGSSPDNMSVNYNLQQLTQQQQQILLQHKQQMSLMSSQNSSIINGTKSRPISPRNALLQGLQNQISAKNLGLGQNRQKNQSPTNFLTSQAQNQNLQKISSQIIDQILKKTSPLENALRPSQQQVHKSNMNLIMSQSPTNQMAGLMAPGPKKILVFPNKKKFPLASQQESQQSMLIGQQKSPKSLLIDKKLKLSKIGCVASLNHSKSQRSLGTSKNRGNTPVNQSNKVKNLMGANQIQLHYQQRHTRNQDQDEIEGQKVGLTKYKSLESFPMDEILSEINKQSKKIKIKHTNSNFGSNERPQSSTSKRMMKNAVVNQINLNNNNQQQFNQSKRMGSPINYSMAQNFMSPQNLHMQPQLQVLTQQQNQQQFQALQQQQAPVLNYNFQNINFINNVNIFEENKGQQKTVGLQSQQVRKNNYVDEQLQQQQQQYMQSPTNFNGIMTSSDSTGNLNAQFHTGNSMGMKKNLSQVKLAGPRKSQGSQISKVRFFTSFTNLQYLK
eukprot:403373959